MYPDRVKKLLVLSAVCSAVFLIFVVDQQLPGSRFRVVFKVVSIAILSLLAAINDPPKKLMATALALSAWGDLLLDIRKLGSLGQVQLFLFGLSAFLAAHMFYIVMFVKESRKSITIARTIACIAVVAVAIFSLRILWPGLAEMRMPVLVYSAVLTAMAITAQRSRFGSLVAVGALFFVASDTMLAMSIFGHPFAGSRILGWLTYYAAQVMITVGVMRAEARQLAAQASS